MYKPKKTPPVSADECSGISGPDANEIPASKKSKKPEKKAKVNLKNDSMMTQADKKNRWLLSLSPTMIQMSQLRMFKGQCLKPAKAQRRQFGLSHTGLLTQKPTRKSQSGNGHASTVCECPNPYSTKHLTEVLQLVENISVLPTQWDAQSTRMRLWSSHHPATSLCTPWFANPSQQGRRGLPFRQDIMEQVVLW